MEGFIVLFTVSTLFVIQSSNALSIPDVVLQKDFSQLGRNWDSTYTMRVDKKDLSYDGRNREDSFEVIKRDESLQKYQVLSSKWGVYAIEQKDTSGKLWRVSTSTKDTSLFIVHNS